MLRRLLAASAVLTLAGASALATGCASTAPDATPATAATDDGPVGTVSEKIDGICGGGAVESIDGIPAYGYCGNFDVWSNNGVDVQESPGAGPGWVKTEGGYGFQCFELTSRYMHFKFGVSPTWNVLYASEMCNTHPAGVTVTQNPMHGDLIVFAGGSCGIAAPAGHVAVVDTVTASTVTAVQQNVAARVTWQKSCASCFLHATANGSNDPCATALDGFYCAGSSQFTGGKVGDYYDCRGGATKSKVTCAGGCEVSPPGVEDICHDAPAPDAGAAASAEAGSKSGTGAGFGAPTAPAAAATTDDSAAAPPTTTTAAPLPIASPSEGGCSTSSSGPVGAGGTWLLLVACVAVARRRLNGTRRCSRYS